MRVPFRLHKNPGKTQPQHVKVPHKVALVRGNSRSTLVDKAVDLSKYYGPINAFNKAQQSHNENYVTAKEKPELFERLKNIFSEAQDSSEGIMQQFRNVAAESEYSISNLCGWLDEFSRGEFTHSMELIDFTDGTEKMLRGELMKLARKLKKCRD